MSLLNTLRFYYRLGGIPLIFKRVFDTATKNDDTLYQFFSKVGEERYPTIVKEMYKSSTGKEINLNHPVSFNDKISWQKIYDKDPMRTRLTDKVLVREWIKEKIGEEYLVSILGIWDSFDDIDFDSLPDRFVLKANHGSTWNTVVRDKKNLNIKEAKQKFDFWMKRNYAYINLEMQYERIEPKIMAETYIEQMDGGLFDYKFHCFGGYPKLIEVIGDRIPATHQFKSVVVKPDWTRNEGLSLVTGEQYDSLPVKPENWEKMLSIAKVLSEGFPYVRVDLYNINGKILFGEMTFTPCNGMDPTDEYFTYAELIDLTRCIR